jgi:hypothetical protein
MTDPFQREAALHRLAHGGGQADVAQGYNIDPAAIWGMAWGH